MKIAIDCRMSGMSGIGVYLDNILEYMVTQAHGNDYLLLGNKTKLARFKDFSNVKIADTNIPIFSLKEAFYFPTKQINQCDAFYTPNFNIPKGIRIPIFSTIHDVVFLDVDGLTSNIGRCIRKIALWRAIRISKKLFTVSNFSKGRIQFHFKKTPEIIVANSGINKDLKAFPNKIASPYLFQYILFIGNLKQHKGLDFLLEAYRLARKKSFSPKLVIVGGYENLRTADSRIVQMIHIQHDDIVFTGNITNEKLYATIANAMLLIQPSKYEGFGLPPLEALYLGCNALLSDIPVFREIYQNLPVTFFDLKNAHDLAQKMITCTNQRPLDPEIKSIIDKKYSLDRSAALIIEQIKQSYNYIR